MRGRLILVFSVSLAACDFGVTRCASDADCKDPGVCSSEKICVVSSDGGPGGGGGTTGGGGGTTGGGGGTTGGGGGATGGGGGMTGGGGATGGGGGAMCPAMCPAGFRCDSGGTTCTSRLTGIVIDTPLANARTKQTTVQVTAHLTTDGLVEPPMALWMVLDTGVSTSVPLTGPNYTATTATLPDGPHTVQMSLVDGGLMTSRSFSVDTVAPTLTGPLPGTSMRDDLVVLSLTASEALELGSIQVTLGGVMMGTSTTACGGDAGCWTLDMSQPAMPGLSGSFQVTATGTDLAGNVATATNLGMVSVSRKRWEVQVNTDEIRATPAVGRDGTLYVGTSGGTGITGSLYGLNPLDGGVSVAATTLLGAVVSVATAVSGADAGLVYFTSNTTTGLVGARLEGNLSQAPVQPASVGNGGKTYSALALVGKQSSTEVGAVAAFSSISSSSTAGRLVVYAPNSPPEGTNASPTQAFDFSASTNEPPNNIIVSGSTAYLLTRPAGAGLFWRPVTGVDGNSPMSGAPLTLASTGSALTMGQSWVDNEALVGGMGTVHGFYRLSTAVDAGNLTVDAENGMAAYNGTQAFAGRGDALIAFNPQQLGAAGVSLAPTSNMGAIRTSPVLGAARGTEPALGYAVNTDGRLFVFRQDGATNSTIDFGDVFTTAGLVYAHPTLDCNRRTGAASSTTGVLYVTNNQGFVVALIVDSPKLLTTPGAWPKYQRTAGNAGNPDNTRFPLNAGCP